MNNPNNDIGRPGDPPGLNRSQTPADHPEAVISIIDYGPEKLSENLDGRFEDILNVSENDNVTWVHIQGIPSTELLESLTGTFGLHPLAVEDVVNLRQRPKLEMYDHGCFVVMRLPMLLDSELNLDQISLFLGERYVLSFDAGDADIFEPVRLRLRGQASGRIRGRGADYLLYALIDLVVDSAFPVIDKLDDHLEDLEDLVLKKPDRSILEDLHSVRRRLILLRRSLAPQRELLNTMIRDDHPYIQESTKIYLRDSYDHTTRVLETLDSFRELVLSTQEIYMSSLSMRMNEVMKVLTMIATIFIPLSFFTGLYGMNFNAEASPWNMPELNAYYGYPILLISLTVAVVGMLIYFKRREWF